jgi:hypothetical protein
MKSKLFMNAFWLLLVVGVANWVGTELYLYWSIWWYDIPMHFMGGLWVALVVAWVYAFRVNINQKKFSSYVWVVIGGTLVVGIAWELYELCIDATSLADGIHYITDTASDIIMDTAGAIVGALYTYKFFARNDQ